MAEYENWKDGRWEFTKSQSGWHFDPSRDPLLGKDSYTLVCRFDADFSDAIKQCMPVARVSTWSSRNDFNREIAEQGLYSASAEEADLIKAGADPKQEVFSRAPADNVKLFSDIAAWLGLEDPMIKFHNQTTGQMLHLHIDNFAARPERENTFRVTEMDRNPESMRRFAIMLADWEMGQAWMFGNAVYHRWKAGTCITWEWRDMPHATVNAGWHPRPMLQITGRQTQRTKDLVRDAELSSGQPLTVVRI